jgi:hypothetical protein
VLKSSEAQIPEAAFRTGLSAAFVNELISYGLIRECFIMANTERASDIKGHSITEKVGCNSLMDN